MRCQELIHFCLVFIGMGILEVIMFREYILGYVLLILGVIISILEVIDI